MSISQLCVSGILIYTWLSACFPVLAHAQELYPIGTKNRYECSVDPLGVATLIHHKRTGSVEESLIALKRVARRRRKVLRESYTETRSSLRRRRKRLLSRANEWRLVLTHTRECIERNDMSVACSIFGGVETSGSKGPYVPRIIDGSKCTRGDSAIVEIRMYDLFGDSLGSCSGTVLNNNTVLTAAHCFANDFGDVQATYIDIFTGSEAIRSSMLYVHPNYNGRGRILEAHDIAIARTSDPLNTQHLGLLLENDLAVDELVAIAGFGLTEGNGTDGLRAGFMRILRTSIESIESRFLPGTGSNTCNGDSGGPLLVRRGSNWLLAGVTSNGDNWTCGRNGKQDISRWANTTSFSNLEFIAIHAPELFED